MTRSRAGAGTAARFSLMAAFAALAAACAAPPRLMTLPTSVASPAPDAPAALASATSACRAVSTFTAAIAVSGSIGGRRVPHGHLIAAVTRTGAARIEATVPLGGTAFVFVVRPVPPLPAVESPQVYESTLLLPHDNRVLESQRPGDVLEAITGVPLGPVALRDTLTGCGATVGRAEHRGDDWIVVDSDEGETFLKRDTAARWQLVAATHRPRTVETWRAEYLDFSSGLPRTIRLAAQDGRFNLALTLSDVDINTDIDAAAFTVRVPPSAVPITLAELRDAGALQ
jgi:hypothetical protein